MPIEYCWKCGGNIFFHTLDDGDFCLLCARPLKRESIPLSPRLGRYPEKLKARALSLQGKNSLDKIKGILFNEYKLLPSRTTIFKWINAAKV